jgi:hypothetical protein
MSVISRLKVGINIRVGDMNLEVILIKVVAKIIDSDNLMRE